MMDKTYQIENHYRRRNTDPIDPILHLRRAAWEAHALWAERARERFCAEEGVEYVPGWASKDLPERTTADPVLAQLVTLADQIATTHMQTKEYFAMLSASYAVAKELYDEHKRLVPVPYSPPPVDDSTECHHGVSFLVDCAECGI